MAGYTINDLKKASSINPLDKLPIQQSGVTRQIEAGMLDNATIINSGDNTGVIREEKTFVIENNSISLQITLGDAVGRIVSDNEFTDSPEAAKGWVITVINNSTKNHALFHGNYSETLAPGDVIHYYWNGARWTVHSLAVDRLTVIGNASFGGTIGGSGITSLLSDYYNKQTVNQLIQSCAKVTSYICENDKLLPITLNSNGAIIYGGRSNNGFLAIVPPQYEKPTVVFNTGVLLSVDNNGGLYTLKCKSTFGTGTFINVISL